MLRNSVSAVAVMMLSVGLVACARQLTPVSYLYQNDRYSVEPSGQWIVQRDDSTVYVPVNLSDEQKARIRRESQVVFDERGNLWPNPEYVDPSTSGGGNGDGY